MGDHVCQECRDDSYAKLNYYCNRKEEIQSITTGRGKPKWNRLYYIEKALFNEGVSIDWFFFAWFHDHHWVAVELGGILCNNI